MLCRVLVMAPDSAIAGCHSSANGLMKEVSPPAAFFPKIEHVQNILHFQNVMGHFMLHILDISSSCFSLVYGESPPGCKVNYSVSFHSDWNQIKLGWVDRDENKQGLGQKLFNRFDLPIEKSNFRPRLRCPHQKLIKLGQLRLTWPWKSPQSSEITLSG